MTKEKWYEANQWITWGLWLLVAILVTLYFRSWSKTKALLLAIGLMLLGLEHVGTYLVFGKVPMFKGVSPKSRGSIVGAIVTAVVLIYFALRLLIAL